MGLLKEFKEFAVKGNVIDMAVGIVIGGAFGGIVKSFIDDLIMPLVGIAGKADFTNWYVPLTDTAQTKINEAAAKAGTTPTLVSAREAASGLVLAYGNFLTVVINFMILAGAVFLLVKAVNTAKRKLDAEQKPAGPPEPPADVKLLTEIRDLLKAR